MNFLKQQKYSTKRTKFKLVSQAKQIRFSCNSIHTRARALARTNVAPVAETRAYEISKFHTSKQKNKVEVTEYISNHEFHEATQATKYPS